MNNEPNKSRNDLCVCHKVCHGCIRSPDSADGKQLCWEFAFVPPPSSLRVSKIRKGDAQHVARKEKIEMATATLAVENTRVNRTLLGK